MANLAKSAVTVNDWWYEGNRVGSKRKVLDVTLVLTGQGDNVDKILASLFGLTTITDAGSARSVDNNYTACPSFDGTYLRLDDLLNGVTLRLIVKGKE